MSQPPAWKLRPSIREVGVYVAFALGIVGVEAVRPVASYRAIELGATALEVGLIGGAFGLLSLVAAIPIGRNVDRAGERGFFLAGVAIVGTAALVQLAAGDLAVVAAGQALLGLGQVSLAISMQTLAANGLPESRDLNFARLAVAASIGQLVGPAMAGLVIGDSAAGVLRQAGIDRAYWISALLAGVALVVAAYTVRSKGGTRFDLRSDRVTTRDLVKRPGVVVALVSSLAVLSTIDITIAYLPLLGEQRGLPPTFVGLLLAVRAGSGLVARLVLTSMLRRMGRARTLSASLFVAAMGLAAVAVIQDRALLVLVIFAVGFGLGVGSPMTASWVASSAPPDGRGLALGVRMTSNRLGQMVIPAALGGLAIAVGSYVVFLASAAGLLVSALWARATGDEPTSAD